MKIKYNKKLVNKNKRTENTIQYKKNKTENIKDNIRNEQKTKYKKRQDQTRQEHKQ